MENFIAAMALISLWNPFLKNTSKDGLKLIFVVTADFLHQSFIKPVKKTAVPMPFV
jgi:hypothetical protein